MKCLKKFSKEKQLFKLMRKTGKAAIFSVLQKENAQCTRLGLHLINSLNAAYLKMQCVCLLPPIFSVLPIGFWKLEQAGSGPAEGCIGS